MIRNNLRNIAIVAHVDHGKTTLVDKMLQQTGAYKQNQEFTERVMDSNAIEKERGITILSKNTAINYKDYKINLIDTPGHADFGGEVERVLKMVSGVILLVDAAEGPMPQTRFVTQKALELNLRLIVVINKIDRPDSRIDEVCDEVLELLLELDASEDQLNSPTLYCSSKNGTCSKNASEPGQNLNPLFETIIEHIQPPQGDEKQPLQFLVSAIDYNEFVGRIAIGKIERGEIKKNEDVMVCNFADETKNYKSKVVNLFEIGSFSRQPINSALVGDIVCVSGIETITIGDTICAPEKVEAVPFSKISEPTVEMTFSVNDGPLAGKEGKLLTSREIKARLEKELLKDVSLKVDFSENDRFVVCGRGEMHLSILIENMRREGFELLVSKPRAMFKQIDGTTCEPFETLQVDVPEQFVGAVMEKMGTRKAQLLEMNSQGQRTKLTFSIPSRGLFGYRNEFLTDTKGEGIMSSIFESYKPTVGEIDSRGVGSLVSFEQGSAVTYGLFNAQSRGQLFIEPGTAVYEGMIVGFTPKKEDIIVNVCKKKHITNMRASGSDEALRLVPAMKLSLEQAIEFLAPDELLEVTPENLRIRKAILNNSARAKLKNKAKK